METTESINKQISATAKKRESSIDILKITGCFSVIILHFTNYFYTPTSNMIAYCLLNSLRWFVFGCVGFYILATGYLNCNKKMEKKYYFKLIPTIITFLFFVIISQLIIHPYDGTSSFYTYLYGGIKYYFWGYNAYYWYMNFYIAFYLIIPFINIIINNINKHQHIMLILVSIFLISLPNFIAIVGDFWEPLKESGVTLPSYFSADCFPFIYYFIGAYLRKYPVHLRPIKRIMYIILLIMSLVLHSCLDIVYLNKYQSNFQIGQHIYTFHSYGNVFTILSCTFFLICLSDLHIKNKIINQIIIFLSSHTLELYLGLLIADKLIALFCDTIHYVISCNILGGGIWFFGELLITLCGAFIIVICKKIYNKLQYLIKK